MTERSRTFSAAYTAALTVFLLVIVGGVAAVWSKLSDASRHRSMTPPCLGVLKVIYSKEETWGIGPGSNQTGIVVFELPGDIANDIDQRGRGFFDQCALARTVAASGRKTRTSYTWQATPVLVEATGADMNNVLTHNIGEYLDKYGFGIAIDRQVEQDIDNALTSQDNWVQDAGSRLIIVMPKASKLVFAYRG